MDWRFFPFWSSRSPTPYMANKGWLSISLDENTDWDVIGRFVRHSYDLALG